MEQKQTLQRRIIIAFFLLTMLLCGGFAITVYFIIHELESILFYEHLQQDAEWLISANKNTPSSELPEGIQLYQVQDNQDEELPEYLKGLTSDRNEVILDERAYHVVIRREGTTRYYLVQDQTNFEHVEQLIGISIVMVFIVALLGALWLGKMTAHKVIAPVVRLADEVKELDLSTSVQPLNLDQYSSDEVGQLASAFAQYAQKIQAFLDRERLFTGDVSHELRTPLMVITSSCELLMAKPGQVDNYSKTVARIYRAAQEMSTLVDTFLNLSRENDAATGQTSRFRVNTIVAEEIQELRRSGSKHAIDMQLHEDVELDALGMPQLFRIVIRNLLRNAIYYTKQGAVTVTIQADSVLIDDTGVGIPEGLGEVIFDRHVRVADSEELTQGLGLGLSIVKRICSYHHWQIRHEPRQPFGSRFILDLVPDQ